MFFKQVNLTTALRPSLLPDETLLFVQDAIGLYEGKYKIPWCQQGHAYLTSHRACYIDDNDPRNKSVAIDLRDVERCELQAGFLRSSPKITLYPKPLRNGFGSLRISSNTPNTLSRQYHSSSSSPVSRSSSPFAPLPASSAKSSSGTWVCPICSFSNPVPSNFDARTATSAFPLPPCLTCGMKPPFSHVLKAAIAAAVPNRGPAPVKQQGSGIGASATNPPNQHDIGEAIQSSVTSVTCPRCTFHNHSSLLACEVCGEALVSFETLRPEESSQSIAREESPGPRLDRSSIDDVTELESIKFSFRAGGEKIFHERVKGALVQRKWLVRHAPPLPGPVQFPITETNASEPNHGQGSHPWPQSTSVGIAGLEQRGLQSRKNNEVVIGTAFGDLEALMASAKDIVALAERFAAETGQDSGAGSAQANEVFSESAAALGMITTRDLLGNASNNLYISELSRNLAEYLTDDRKAVLKREGGIMSLVHLWAVYNRSRNGVELVSPSDFEKAARLWEELRLPVRLRRFRSGLLVVQRSDWSDENTILQLKAWLQELHSCSSADTGVDWTHFGHGVTAQEAAQRFGWSLGVAGEELEMAEERGILCREEGIEGLKFWENHLLGESTWRMLRDW